jgi:Domain of unknown function (DUF2017)
VRGPFKRRGRTVLVGLPTEARGMLARLLGDVHEMLDDGTSARAGERDPLAELVGIDDDWLSDLTAGPEFRTAAERFDDPAMARLLPDAARDDPAAAAEFRRLTEHGLRSRKRTALARARSALERADPVVLDAQEAQALLKGLTDLRLVIAERLGLRTDQDAEAVHAVLAQAGDSDTPWVVMAALYDQLTWWQEALVRELPRRG